MKPMHVQSKDGERLHIPDFLDITILISGAVTDGSFCVMEDAVPAGIGPARHIHPSQDEVFFVLEGSFKFEVDGQELFASAGDIAVAPRGTVHAFKNIGDATGRLRYVFTPAGDIEELFRAIHAGAKEAGVSHELMSTVAEPFDQEIVGPPL